MVMMWSQTVRQREKQSCYYAPCRPKTDVLRTRFVFQQNYHIHRYTILVCSLEEIIRSENIKINVHRQVPFGFYYSAVTSVLRPHTEAIVFQHSFSSTTAVWVLKTNMIISGRLLSIPDRRCPETALLPLDRHRQGKCLDRQPWQPRTGDAKKNPRSSGNA